MGQLERRLSALEAIAEEARLRPIRALAEARGVDFDTLMARYAEGRAETARLRAEGLSDEEIVARKAARRGLTVGELRRQADELAERFP